MSVDNPLKWLLSVLPYHVPADQLPFLMERYEINKKAYERQVAIRKAERIIKSMERRNYPDEAARLARWRDKLDKLKEES